MLNKMIKQTKFSIQDFFFNNKKVIQMYKIAKYSCQLTIGGILFLLQFGQVSIYERVVYRSV